MPRITDKIARIALGDIIGRGIGFATTIYLARLLGVDSFGLITVAISFLGYANWFADLGLTYIGGREIAKEPLKRIFRAKEIFVLKIVLNIIVLVFVQFFVPKLTIDTEQKSIILSFAFALIPYTLILEWYYNGKQHFGKIALIRIFSSSVYFILTLLFIKSSKDVEIVPYLFIAGAASSALFYLFYSYKENPFVLPTRGWYLYKDLLKSAFKIGSGTFFTQLIQLLPPILIGLLLSTADAGIYGAAMRVILIAMIVDRIFVNILLPNLSAQWTTNKDAAKKNILLVSRIMLPLAGSLSLFIAISAPFLIDLIFGSEYQSSAIILSILSIFLFCTFLNSLFSFGLVAIGKDQDFFNATIFGGIFSSFIILFASLSSNLLYVVYAVSFAEILFMGASFFWFNKYTHLNFIAPFVLSILICFILYYLSTLIFLPSLVEAGIAILIFIPSLFLTRIINSDHLIWLKTKLIP